MGLGGLQLDLAGRDALRGAYNAPLWAGQPRVPPSTQPVEAAGGGSGFSNMASFKVPLACVLGCFEASLNNKSHGLGTLTCLTSPTSISLYLLERNDSLFPSNGFWEQTT